jgi:hypothetical protein
MADFPFSGQIKTALRDWLTLDLRYSHVIIAAAVLVGGLINLFFAHGWTIWPAVLAFGILTYINEAVDRSGQGIPPVQVYALFIAAGVVWMAAVCLLMSINKLILFVGIAAILYRILEAILRQRERERLIAHRRAAGVCLHCGEIYDPSAVFCQTCGEEPNPADALLRRVAQIYRSTQDIARTRAVLGKSAASPLSAKEQALITRRQGQKLTHPSPLPKAAKLGGSSSRRAK